MGIENAGQGLPGSIPCEHQDFLKMFRFGIFIFPLMLGGGAS